MPSHIPSRFASQTSGFRTIVHLGAGRCRELASYLASNAERIVLVEAEPDLLAKLRARAAGEHRVEVIGAAVSGRGGLKTLNVYNEPELSSLRKPSGIATLYPGLRREAQVALAAIGAADLLSELKASGDRSALVVDAPGEEYSILEALSSSDALESFESVLVHAGAVPLYEGGRDAAAVSALFAGLGWTVSSRGLPGEPDRRVISADFSSSRRELALAQEALAANAKTIEQLEVRANASPSAQDERRGAHESALAGP